MTDLRSAAEKALKALEYKGNIYHMDCPAEAAITALRAALEQPERPNFTLSCGCPSQYGGVPAYWERDGSTAFGMICEKHWYEYDARGQA